MSGGWAGQLRVSFLLLRPRMIELRSVSASNDANPVTGVRLRAAHALLRWSAEELATRTKSASRPSGALRHTMRRDDFAARLSAGKAARHARNM